MRPQGQFIPSSHPHRVCLRSSISVINYDVLGLTSLHPGHISSSYIYYRLEVAWAISFTSFTQCRRGQAQANLTLGRWEGEVFSLYKSQKKSLIWHHVFYKGAENTYFRFCRPYSLKWTTVPQKQPWTTQTVVLCKTVKSSLQKQR